MESDIVPNDDRPLSDVPPRIDPNLKDVVYQVGVAHGSEEDWDYMWGWYNTTEDPFEKSLCLRALAQSREPLVLSRYG